MDPARPHLTAIPGIRDQLVNPTWPWKFSAEVRRYGIDADVDATHYKAGPFPRLNKFLVNPPVAKAIANRILLRREIIGPGPIHLLGHSNGGVVALDVCKRLARAGVVVDTLVAVGAAFDSDIEKSGLMHLVDKGHLLKVVAYASSSDVVIKHLQTFPGAYGSVGARGLTWNKQRTGAEIRGYDHAPAFGDYITRRFDGFSHSQYWADPWREETFRTALTDMGFFSN